MQEYKQIEIELNRNTDEIEKEIILEINNSFSKDDLYIENGGNKIIFNLRLLDLDEFKRK